MKELPGPVFNRGQSLLEVLIAMTVAILIISGLVAAVTAAIKNAQFSQKKSTAIKYAQEGLEWVRSERDTNWQTFSARSTTSAAGNTYCLSDFSWASGVCTTFSLADFFKREANLRTINPTDPDKIQVKMTVSWVDGSGTHKSEITTQFTRPTGWQ